MNASIKALCVLQEEEIGRGRAVCGRLDESQNSTTKTQTLHSEHDSRPTITLSSESRQSHNLI